MDWLWRKLGATSKPDLEGLKIHFDGCWAVSAQRWDAKLAFETLADLTPDDAFLCLEGGAHSSEISTFMNDQSIPAAAKIPHGTIWPRRYCFHFPADSAIFSRLSEFASCHALPEICDHLIVYSTQLILVDWYDVFDRDAYVSATIPEDAVSKFATLNGAKYRTESI